MKYTYEELQIMLNETEKALDVMKKFAEVTMKQLEKEIREIRKKILHEHNTNKVMQYKNKLLHLELRLKTNKNIL